jgi:tellurite resistance protein
MRESLSDSIRRALKGVGPFPRDVVDAIVEIAYLTMAVDQQLREEELEAFTLIWAELNGGQPPQERELYQRLDKLGEALDRTTILGRLEKSAGVLGEDKRAKLAAYRVASLMALADLDAADREFEFDLDLISALGLTQEEADEVADQVNAAITPPG